MRYNGPLPGGLMRLTPVLVVALFVPALALAWGKKEEKKAPLPALKAGIHHQCLTPLAEAKDPAGLLGMGILDQTKGDLKAAKTRYVAAFATKYDVVSEPVDLTFVSGVIWIQSAACPVPVPAAPAGETIEVSATKMKFQPHYPEILQSIRSEGDVMATVWVGSDGKAARIHIDSVSVGPIGIERLRDPGEEEAERHITRVQIALQSIEDLRGFDFGAANANKSFAWKLPYFPPRAMGENLPGERPNTAGAAAKGALGEPGLGAGSTKPTP